MSTFNLGSIANTGGQKILGVNNLVGYINNGYGGASARMNPDSVEISKKNKTKRNIKDILTFIGVAGGSALAIWLGKTGKLDGVKPAIDNFKKTLREVKWPTFKQIGDTIAKPFKYIGDAFKKAFKK